MAACTITFTDTIGAATLKNGKPSPADRFSNWVQRTTPTGEIAYRQSDLAPTRVRFGWRYGVSFELRAIPLDAVSAVRMVDVADRLIAHLLNGGSCVLNTGDSATTVHSGCTLMPGTEPALTMSDPVNLEYTLSLSLIGASRLFCYYA